MVARFQFKFKGTKEQFVDWLKGNVQHGLWPVPGYQLMEDEYNDWLQWLRSDKPLFIETYPFEPPPSFDFPFTLEIRGRIGRVQPMEAWGKVCLLCGDPLRRGEPWQDVVRPFCTRCWRKAEGNLDLPPEPKGGGGLLYSRLCIIAFFEVHYPIPEGILIGRVDWVWGTGGYLDELLKKLERVGWLEWLEEAKERSVTPISTEGEADERPWERIPDVSYHRHLVELWWAGWSSSEIGEQLGYSPKTILNRISDLRRIYGEEIVPKRHKRDKRGK